MITVKHFIRGLIERLAGQTSLFAASGSPYIAKLKSPQIWASVFYTSRNGSLWGDNLTSYLKEMRECVSQRANRFFSGLYPNYI